MPRPTFFFLIVPIVLAGQLAGQVAENANRRYRTEEGRKGIAANLGGPDRAARQKPKELIKTLRISAGDTVCDMGTGVGFMLPYLSQAVGPKGRVLAQDIFPDFLAQARKSAAALKNVTFVQGTDQDPKLPANTCDLVLVLDAYHHFDNPSAMLNGIKASFTAKGRLALVDFYKRPGAMGNGTDAVEHIRLDMPDVIREVENYGFRAGERGEHLSDSQYYVIFFPRTGLPGRP